MGKVTGYVPLAETTIILPRALLVDKSTGADRRVLIEASAAQNSKTILLFSTNSLKELDRRTFIELYSWNREWTI
ncbi:hypothetical protein GJ744_008532 [Endocarpon pusillum]|uniref:Uncharacterized protein n=1 Tax=Endocarpon pusillum TaxID=364733 RepID=A0A8H7E6T4_9EURO|nr:hypothetical protein GJ744_008532 [Endocarpon pusillum]